MGVVCACAAVMLTVAAADPAAATRHVLFAFVDHFEPSGHLADRQVSAWVDDYMAMAGRHLDADGRHPVHSYFVISPPAIEPGCLDATLIKLNQATYAGFGEVEYHGHHGTSNEGQRSEQEAYDDLVHIIGEAKERFSHHGALVTAEAEPRVVFGFIHGMWALDNSRCDPWRSGDQHYEYCGVNRELELLSRLGAYADFTFPAWGPMEPRLRDAIYYAADDDGPASYQRSENVRPVEVNQPAWGDLMLVEGPSVDYGWGFDGTDNIGYVPWVTHDWPLLKRMDFWVSHNIHVIGNDQWVFVKVHTHGCAGDITDPQTWDCFFGKAMDRFYSDIEAVYNDGVTWKLHYVSAREMVNVIKAAEAGFTGDPGQYRDFLIPPYANTLILTDNAYRLVRYDAVGATLQVLGWPDEVDMSFKGYSLSSRVQESEDLAGPWQESDTMKILGGFGEMRILDTRPSRFYRLFRVPQ